jgi:hypothetical protein
MKKLIVLMAYLLVCGTSFAQTAVKITGKITDEKAEPIAYALVKLVKHGDTALIKKVQTGFEGEFTFDQVLTGEYVLLINMVGYKNNQTTKIAIGKADVILPNISLESLTNQLKQVIIEGKKPYIEHKIDKTVLNVESSIVSAGSTALEVLEKAPGVTVDRQNDQIKLNNKSGITVMIDGKTNFLSGADITTLLSI